ncbi:hypothetical protein F4774DRAFT_96804 [Daldinia eschscholtzii]|nr:hypothetical protein F4774DRAFT_96804 [Daldinia eschscholtzii]
MPSNDRIPLLTTTTTTTTRRQFSRSSSMYWTLACLYGASAVGLGAFGAHGLKKVVSDPAKIANWATAAHYQLVHSVALLVAAQVQNPISGVLFTTGMTFFSGSLYLLVLNPARFKFLGPVTPLGGLCCAFTTPLSSPSSLLPFFPSTASHFSALPDRETERGREGDVYICTNPRSRVSSNWRLGCARFKVKKKRKEKKKKRKKERELVFAF